MAQDPFNKNHLYVGKAVQQTNLTGSATGGEVRCMTYQNGTFDKIWKTHLFGMGFAASIFLDCHSECVVCIGDCMF